MSASHEPSYYEIALTNRQVLTVFVVLLVCVVAAFFSGVWIGRRGGMETAESEVARVEQPAEGPEEGSLEELHFFSDAPDGEPRDRQKGSTEATEPPAVVLELQTEEEPVADQPIHHPSASTKKESLPLEETAVSSSPEPALVGQELGNPVVDSSGGQLAEPSSTGAEGSGELLIQVFFSVYEERARSLVERLVGSGYPAFLSPVEVEGQTMYRVRVGPYAEHSRAEEVADKLRRAFKLETWITSLQSTS